MNKGNGLVLGPKMRVLYQGTLHYLVDMSANFNFNIERGEIEIIQTFLIAKVEPGSLDDMSTLYEVLASEITPLMGNDFWENSPYSLGVARFLGGQQ